VQHVAGKYIYVYKLLAVLITVVYSSQSNPNKHSCHPSSCLYTLFTSSVRLLVRKKRGLHLWLLSIMYADLQVRKWRKKRGLIRAHERRKSWKAI